MVIAHREENVDSPARLALLVQSLTALVERGGTVRESTMLGFPATTLRSSTERPEALDTGAIAMTDLDPTTVVAGVQFAMDRGTRREGPVDYQVTNTSERVVNLILASYHQNALWAGLRG